MAQIELEGINRVFTLGDSEVHALCEVELSIEAGEYVAVMGPSRSGKSTLLNLLGLLDRLAHDPVGKRLVAGHRILSHASTLPGCGHRDEVTTFMYWARLEGAPAAGVTGAA